MCWSEGFGYIEELAGNSKTNLQRKWWKSFVIGAGEKQLTSSSTEIDRDRSSRIRVRWGEKKLIILRKQQIAVYERTAAAGLLTPNLFISYSPATQKDKRLSDTFFVQSSPVFFAIHDNRRVNGPGPPWHARSYCSSLLCSNVPLHDWHSGWP